MVSNARLAQIHLRLQQIYNQCGIEKEAFAGTNIMLLGDLLQVLTIDFNIVLVSQNVSICLETYFYDKYWC
jgi:hypothetical protein